MRKEGQSFGKGSSMNDVTQFWTTLVVYNIQCRYKILKPNDAKMLFMGNPYEKYDHLRLPHKKNE